MSGYGHKRQWMVRVLLALITYHLSLITSTAQDEPEYRMEVGAGVGLQAYQGDLNGSILKGMKPMGALVAKYKLNPRMAWGAQLAFGGLKGSSRNVETWYPGLNEQPVDFSTSLTNFDVRYEYNFWPFGTGQEYLGARPLTPFMALGAGMTFASVKGNGSVTALTAVLGCGVKYKLRQRLNLTLEWMVHFTGTDKLDGLKDPYGIKSSGLFKNNDGFTTLQLSLTYDLWAKCKTCHNDL